MLIELGDLNNVTVRLVHLNVAGLITDQYRQ